MLKQGKKIKDLRQQLELADHIQEIRNELAKEPLKGLRNSIYVRNQLAIHEAFEATDKDGTVGVVVEPETYKSLLKYVDLLEEQLELNSFEAMAESRKGDIGFVSGNQLVGQALNLFDDNEDEIRRFLDDDN